MKSGFITISGRPNAGKSTLLNALVGEKIAGVSPKPQTTRTRVNGVITRENAQIILVDTPGIHRSKDKLGAFMNKEAEEGRAGADVIWYMIDASRFNIDAEEEILGSLGGGTVILVINKIDKVEKSEILNIIEKFRGIREFAEIVPISAVKAEGTNELLEMTVHYLPEGPFYFPDGVITDAPDERIISEFIREKMMKVLDDEIPYGTAVGIEKYNYDKKRDVTDVTATLYCERENHKGIIIGKGGATLKKIGTYAREDIERFTGTKVNLQLWLKVRDNWRENPIQLNRMGYGGNK